MNRRLFIGSMLGVAAATALPSEVWPFRKIFLPPAKIVWPPPALHEVWMDLPKTLTGAYPALWSGPENRTASSVVLQQELSGKYLRVLHKDMLVYLDKITAGIRL